MYTHTLNLVRAGADPEEAAGALILIHGRGGTAENIINLAKELNADKLAIYAPQASNQSWYPYSFVMPVMQNEPALTSALEVIHQVVEQVVADGIPKEKIYFAGFSQGACLTLEYLGRYAQKYAGAVAFTGGLIGKELIGDNYKGDFNHTPILITTGNPDPHVPLSRVEESLDILKGLNADVTMEVYKGRPHTISFNELELANELIFRE